jgi:hypothetical protein
VLGDLAAEFPLLATLVERTAGGQRRLLLGGNGNAGPGEFGGTEPLSVQPGPDDTARPDTPIGSGDGPTGETPDGEEPKPQQPGAEPGSEPGTEPPSPAAGQGSVTLPTRRRRKKAATLSLQIRFEQRSDDVGLARLVDTTVWVNDAHPAYRRAVASRAEGYHLALAVATALAPLTVEPHETQRFVGTFLASWGEAGGKG